MDYTFSLSWKRRTLCGVKRLGPASGSLLLVLALAACAGDDEPVPVDELPGGKLLADLTADEFTGLCNWAGELSRQKLNADASCDGTQVRFHGCMRVNPRCTATVDDWRRCLPDMIDRFADEPCEALGVTSPATFAAFIEEIPSCEGLGHCANTLDHPDAGR